MISGQISERFDEAVDQFEIDWTSNSRMQIGSLLREYRLEDNLDAVTELIRIDIELRYTSHQAVRLQDYFGSFGHLLQHPESVAQIAFEDYRQRCEQGQDLSVSRWRDLPGVANTHWYQRLISDSALRNALARIDELESKVDADTAFAEAMQTAGFRLIREIGRGTFGRVYLATQSELANRFVVLKVVSDSHAESQSLAMLQHTNIVPIYSIHQIMSNSLICMPYAGSLTLKRFMGGQSQPSHRSGQSLVDTVRAGLDETRPMDEESGDSLLSASEAFPAAHEAATLKPLQRLSSLRCSDLAVWVFKRLASGLAHSHARGVLHGDLKPSNVLIRNDGEPALIDFNLSQRMQVDRPDLIGGTLPYMAPESYQALMDKNTQLDVGADIYGLGVMLFEFVTGRYPFSVPPSSAPIDLTHAIQERTTQEPQWQESDVASDGLKSIIDRCLEYEPSNRYLTAENLRTDLECEGANLPLVFANEPIGHRAKKWIRRHPNATSTGTLTALSLAILLPLVAFAFAWRDKSNRMAVAATTDRFERDSHECLAALMADPDRASLPNIELGMKPLLDHGILEKGGVEQFYFDGMPDESKSKTSETLLRHIAQVAYLEIARLRPAMSRRSTTSSDSSEQPGPQNAEDLTRLGRLIATMDKIPLDRKSRAIALIHNDHARFVGNESDERLAEALAIPEDTATEKYLDAIRLIAGYQYSRANEKLRNLAIQDAIPRDLVWTSLGRAQFALADYESAKLSFTQSINFSPKSSELRELRGRCFMQLSKGDLAIREFDEAIKLNAGNKTAWYHRGLVKLRKNRHEEAIADFDRAMDIDSSFITPLLKRAIAYREIGKKERADADLKRAMAQQNLDKFSLISRARARDDADMDGVLSDLQRALEKRPDDPYVLRSLARHYVLQRGDHETGIGYYDKAIQIFGDAEHNLVDRAISLAALSRYDDAIQDLDEALIEPNSNRTYYQGACVCSLLPERKHHIRGLGLLARAVRGGFDAKNLKSDPDLKTLREMPAFQAILRTYDLSRMSEPAKQ